MATNNFAPSALNKFQKEMEKTVRESKLVYPVVITTGKDGAITPSLVNLNEDERKVVKYEIEKGDFKLNLTLKTYNYIDGKGEQKSIQLPDLESLTTEDVYALGAKLFKFTEAYRQLINIFTMTAGEVAGAVGPTSAGLMMADRLLGLPGVSSPVENVLRNVWQKSGSPQTLNEYIQQYASTKEMTEAKDKFINASLIQYAEACNDIAKNIRKAGPVLAETQIQSTGVQPTIVNEAGPQVSEISALKESQQTFKNIL